MDYPISHSVGTGGRRRRRLLFMVTQFETGGAQAQALLRMSHLSARHDVTLCLLMPQAGYLLDRVRERGIRVVSAGLDQCPTPYGKLRRLRRIIEAERPDVATGVLCWDHTYGMLAATLADVPLLLADLQNERASVHRSFSRGFRMAEAICLGACADLIVGCSEQVRASYVRAWPWAAKRARAILNTIDLAEVPRPVRPGSQADRTLPTPVRIGTLGRLAPQKNHGLLLGATARVVTQHPDVRVLIAGTGPLEAATRRRIAALGLDKHVELIGETKTPYDFLNTLDLFVLSSSWEGLPVVAMEAMACGVPVISTRVGGVEEIIDASTGVLCPAGDEVALADAIGRLVADPARRQALGAASRARAQREFDVQAGVAQWEALYSAATPARTRTGVARAIDSGAAKRGELPDGPVSRMLLMRLCPQARLLRIAAELCAAYPGARLDVLCQDEWADATRAVLPDARVIAYGAGRFTLRTLGWRTLLALRSARYDLVALPYNLASEPGYRQAEVTALVAGRGRVQCYAAWNDDVYPLQLRIWRDFPRQALTRYVYLLPAAALILRALGKALWRRTVRRAPLARQTA